MVFKFSVSSFQFFKILSILFILFIHVSF